MIVKAGSGVEPSLAIALAKREKGLGCTRTPVEATSPAWGKQTRGTDVQVLFTISKAVRLTRGQRTTTRHYSRENGEEPGKPTGTSGVTVGACPWFTTSVTSVSGSSEIASFAAFLRPE